MPDPLNWYHLSDLMADVSAAGVTRFCVPEAGYLRRVDTTLANAITLADSVLTISVDNVALTPTITIPFTGSAEGSTTSTEYFAPVKKGSWIEVTSDGGATTTSILGITLTLSK